jgi:hypothetical protein
MGKVYLEVNSSDLAFTPARRLTALGLLTEFLQVLQGSGANFFLAFTPKYAMVPGQETGQMHKFNNNNS